ncbi:hypothetical protein DQ04_05651020 [Trypanosoma grayi]|uniref:hypothetical protein n=1 Tax=Trypanosoma grayi TaxID=71804 RepID=UPI0004F42C2F|nr:hypothetical protein DQ04_05651020 [Trypanosoma grayi]KEG09186.1 hypothetical protein DQ04_05651020 [Trypanosoma grayi]
MSDRDELLALMADGDAPPSFSPSLGTCSVDRQSPASLFSDAMPADCTGRCTATPSAVNALPSSAGVMSGANTTSVVPRLSSPDRLRMRTYKVQKELQELITQHNNRHERLQNLRARQSVSRGSCTASQRRSTESSSFRPKSLLKKTEGPQLPNLRKCFEEARTKYLMETERKKKVMPPLYSSHIPRNEDKADRRQQRDIMKDPDSFGLRFFSHAHAKEAQQPRRHM